MLNRQVYKEDVCITLYCYLKFELLTGRNALFVWSLIQVDWRSPPRLALCRSLGWLTQWTTNFLHRSAPNHVLSTFRSAQLKTLVLCNCVLEAPPLLNHAQQHSHPSNCDWPNLVRRRKAAKRLATRTKRRNEMSILKYVNFLVCWNCVTIWYWINNMCGSTYMFKMSTGIWSLLEKQRTPRDF